MEALNGACLRSPHINLLDPLLHLDPPLYQLPTHIAPRLHPLLHIPHIPPNIQINTPQLLALLPNHTIHNNHLQIRQTTIQHHHCNRITLTRTHHLGTNRIPKQQIGQLPHRQTANLITHPSRSHSAKSAQIEGFLDILV